MKMLRALCVAALLGALALPASAIDLSQAYRAALQEDATLRAARANAQAGREQLPQARAQLLPNAVLSVGRNRNDLTRTAPNFLGQPSSLSEVYPSYSQTLQVRQPIYRKQLFAGYEQAKFAVEDVNAVLDFELTNVAVKVGGAYFEAMLAQDQLELFRAQIVTNTALLDAARKGFAAGSGTRTDIDEAQARLDLARAQALEAQQHVDFTRRQLQLLINQPITSLAALDLGRLQLRSPQPVNLEDWVRMAEDGSPEIQALRARREVARLAVDKARGMHHPTLDAVAQYTKSASENVLSPSTEYKNFSLGLQLQLPLYSGGYVDSAVRQTLAEFDRAENQLEALRRDLGVRVHREFRGITEGIEKVHAFEQAVRSAEQMVNSSRKSYQAGVRTQLDILNAEQQRVQALRDLAQARYMVLNSQIRLQALIGGDMQAVIDQTNGFFRH